MVILTQIDRICPETEKDTCKVFLSKSIKEKVMITATNKDCKRHLTCLFLNKVREVCEKFGINENMVFPVQNYTKEVEKELGIDILMLLTLQQILRNSEDYFTDLLE